MSGILYGVGVGPGDPNLLTLAAVNILRSVSAVLVPKARQNHDSLALYIAKPHLPASCEVLEAVFPMTENRNELKNAWDTAAQTMIQRSASGEDVAFLTLGDAMLYSTWSYLLKAIIQRKPDALTVTIPGITAMSACAAATGVPLAEGREPLLVWPDEPPKDLERLLAIAPNLVFMKAARHLSRLSVEVEKLGMTASAVSRCTLPDEKRTVNLRDWEDAPNYFTTVLMHAKGSE